MRTVFGQCPNSHGESGECAWGLSDGAGNVRIGNPATRPGSDEVGGAVGAPGGGASPVADGSVGKGILVEFDTEAGCVGQVQVAVTDLHRAGEDIGAGASSRSTGCT